MGASRNPTVKSLSPLDQQCHHQYMEIYNAQIQLILGLRITPMPAPMIEHKEIILSLVKITTILRTISLAENRKGLFSKCVTVHRVVDTMMTMSSRIAKKTAIL